MKGQSAVEYMMFVGVLFFILLVIAYNSSSVRYQLIGIERVSEARDLSERLAGEINYAARIGDGYERSFILDSSGYQIEVGNYSVFVSWGKGSVIADTISDNVMGNFKNGRNVIRNVKGVIYVD